MSWADEKAKLKAKVHETFALPAVYTRAASGSAGIDIVARVNNNVRLVGGSSLAGFMQILQDVPKLRIAKADLGNVPPDIQDKISIASEGIVAVVNNRNPDDGAYYVVEVEML